MMKALAEFLHLIVHFWQDLLDSLSSDGGHIFILAMMVWGGLAGMHFQITKADELFLGAFTALLVLLRATGSNKSRRENYTQIEVKESVPQDKASAVLGKMSEQSQQNKGEDGNG